MTKRPIRYELSNIADNDIEEIFDYTEKEYGFDKAIIYVSGFEELFSSLVDNPELGRTRTEIKKGLRSIPKDEHIVFYRILSDHIRIVRVLHGSRDLPNFLKGR